MKSLVAAIRFLTILPLPGTYGTEGEDLARSVAWFPVVGLLLGAVAAGIAWGLMRVAPPGLAASLILVVLLAFSGALHMEGLCDTADGFLSSRPRERILEIMKDSHVGVMGVIAVGCVLLVKWSALSALPRESFWRTVFLMPVAGRCAIVMQMAVLPYVRPGGVGTLLCRQRPRVAAVWSVIVLLGTGWLLLRVPGLVAGLAALAGTLWFSRYSWLKIGGATGDTFGATCEIAEIIPALVMAAWPAIARHLG